MSNFKVGDAAICIDDSGAPLLQTGKEYTVLGVAYAPCCGVQTIDLGLGFEADKNIGVLLCSNCDCVYKSATSFFRSVRFEKPRHIHTKSAIRNRQVLKRLATLPQVTERIEIPVRKQEGVNV